MSSGDHSTKERMISAGVRLFAEGRAPILRSLTAGTVAKEAGFHRQTFYRHWETQCDYVTDLVLRVFASPADDGQTEVGFGAGRGPGSFEESVRAQARRDFDVLERDPTASVRVGLIAMGQLGDARASEVAGAYYEAANRELTARYSQLLAEWDRRPRPPHTIEDIAMAVQAQLVGNMLHVLVSGESTQARRLYVSTGFSLVRDMSEPLLDVSASASANGHASVADSVGATR